MFAKLVSGAVVTPVVFMTATLMEPASVLHTCGLPEIFDDAFFISPMRRNLEFDLKYLHDGQNWQSSHRVIMQHAVAAIKQHAPTGRAVVFVMARWQLDPVAAWIRLAFPGRTVLTYHREKRTDLSSMDDTSIVVATSALQTGDGRSAAEISTSNTYKPAGANLPWLCLVILYGFVFSPENLLQAGGRAARSDELNGKCIMMCTPYSIQQALKTGGNARGLEQVM